MIRVINGTVGVYDGARMIVMTSKSEAFALSKERMASLVAAGIAEYAENTESELTAAVVDGFSTAFKKTEADTGSTQSPAALPAYNADMKLDVLKAIAKTYGVDAKSMISKAQVVAAIDAAKEAAQDDDGETDEDENRLPDMNAADPV